MSDTTQDVKRPSAESLLQKVIDWIDEASEQPGFAVPTELYAEIAAYRKQPVQLSHNDICDITFSLRSKAQNIREGAYDEYHNEIAQIGSETAEWAEHLEDIAARVQAGEITDLEERDWNEIFYCGIEESLAEKIGPDGASVVVNGVMVV